MKRTGGALGRPWSDLSARAAHGRPWPAGSSSGGTERARRPVMRVPSPAGGSMAAQPHSGLAPSALPPLHPGGRHRTHSTRARRSSLEICDRIGHRVSLAVTRASWAHRKPGRGLRDVRVPAGTPWHHAHSTGPLPCVGKWRGAHQQLGPSISTAACLAQLLH